MKTPGYESDRFRVMKASWSPDGLGRAREVAKDWDRSPGELIAASSGDKLFATAANFGQRSIFEIDLNSGSVRTIVRDGSSGGIQETPSGLLYSQSNLKSPAELFHRDAATGEVAAVTDINREAVDAVAMGDYEQFRFEGHAGEEVYGYLVKPFDYADGVRYPIAFLVHGGPQGSFGNNFHYRWNPQAYAGAGYAVVMIDFHGSVGYGQAFTDSIQGDWGGKPLEDLKKGFAHALFRYPVSRRHSRLCSRRLLRWLHDELDRWLVVQRLPLPGESRRRLRPALDVLHHRGALVPRTRVRRSLTSSPLRASRSTTRSISSRTSARRR